MSLITRGLNSNLLISRGLGFSSVPVVEEVVEIANGGNFKKKRKIKISKQKLTIRLIGKRKAKVDLKLKVIGFVKKNINLSLKVKANVLSKLVLSTFGNKTKKVKNEILVNGSKRNKASLLLCGNGKLAILEKIDLLASGIKRNKENNKYLVNGAKYELVNSSIDLLGAKNKKIKEKFTLIGLDDPFKLTNNFTELQEVALMDVDL